MKNSENLATKYRKSLFWHHPSWNVSLRPSWQIPSSSTCYIQFTSLLKFLRTTEGVLSGVRLECILLLHGSWPQLAFSGKGKFDAIGLPEVGNLLHFNCWEFSSCEMCIFVRVLAKKVISRIVELTRFWSAESQDVPRPEHRVIPVMNSDIV